jgi:predicted Zn-dependent protease
MGLAGSILSNTNLPPVAHFRVATLLHRAGNLDAMTQALNLFLSRVPPETPPEVFIDATRMYLAAQKADKANITLNEYLKRRPADWKAWMDQASIQLVLGKSNDAVRALESSIRAGGNDAINFIQQNPNFAPVRDEALRRSQTFIGFPGGKGLMERPVLR